ncbi:thiolase family protein [uncultured Kocuria sp.]|uniref:thiolase family protein n=1 Tax=uncultured Kocuria sp. TaxID=259305 RepID=UPI002597F79E|nr:thiolase family protein [uncultured Kocuria sp.]MCT1367402.1 thiolase family protein [Rothia sp. p3-SID1597]
MNDVAIISVARTPITGRSRALSGYGAETLAGNTLRALREMSGISPDAVVLGNCTGPGGNVGRMSALAAGFGTDCVGWGLDAQCGSGMLAVMQAVQHVACTGQMVAAGGTESASTAPVRSINGEAFERAPFAPEGFPDPDMIEAADHLAAQRGISRARQDEFAVRSHALTLSSAEFVGEELISLRHPESGNTIVDDGPRKLTPHTTSRFSPVRTEPRASVTPVSAARISDGAAAVLLRPESQASGPRWVIRGSAMTGGDPALPGILPVSAIRGALKASGMGLERIAAVEIVEAFAAQTLAVADDLGLAVGGHIDPRVNAWGGALALGHPWGASGAVALVRLAHRLRREGPGAVGVAACAIGGGMGTAMMLEYVE